MKKILEIVRKNYNLRPIEFENILQKYNENKL